MREWKLAHITPHASLVLETLRWAVGNVSLSGFRAKGSVMSRKHLVLILTEPTEGNEAEFNDYYENLHLDEVLKTTNLQSAQRFRLAGQAGEACPLPYLAVYETEAESAQAVLDDLNATRSQRQQSGALNKRTGRVWVFEEIGPKHAK